MTTYRFTGETPLIFSALSYGPDVVVQHEAEAPTDGPLPDGPVDGATVVLYPGDIITIPGTFESAYLEDVDAKPEAKEPAEKAPEAKAPTEKAPDAKAPADEPKAPTDAAPAAPATAPTTE